MASKKGFDVPEGCVFGVLAEKANSKNAACVHVQDTTKSARDASKINAIHALPPTTPLAHLCVLIQATPKASQSIPRTERPAGASAMRSQMSEMGRTRGYPVFYCSLVPTRLTTCTRGRRRKGEAKKSSVGPVLESSLDSIIHVDLDLFCTCTGNFILSIIMD